MTCVPFSASQRTGLSYQGPSTRCAFDAGLSGPACGALLGSTKLRLEVLHAPIVDQVNIQLWLVQLQTPVKTVKPTPTHL